MRERGEGVHERNRVGGARSRRTKRDAVAVKRGMELVVQVVMVYW